MTAPPLPVAAPEPVHVTGGAGGTTAHLEDLLGMAALLRTSAIAIDDACDQLRSPSLGWTLGETAHADPSGAREVCDGLDATALALGAVHDRVDWLAVLLRSAVDSYDHAEHSVLSTVAHVVSGATFGVSCLAPVPTTAVWFGSGLGNDPLYSLEQLAALAAIDGRPVLHDLGTDPRPQATAPPRTLTDLVAGVALRDGGRPGEISVSLVDGPDGRRRAIVDIPGTKSWNPLPVPDVTSVGTDILAITGHATTYERGIFAALSDAGVGPDTEVMLVGHSEGGIVAVDAARDAARSGRFRITHVVTAGSPIGRIVGGVPANVQVLALENRADLVPALEGSRNPDQRNVTTVSVDDEHGSIGANHSLDQTYEPAAAAADAAGNRSIDAFVDSADGFLRGSSMTTHAYRVTRAL